MVVSVMVGWYVRDRWRMSASVGGDCHWTSRGRDRRCVGTVTKATSIIHAQNEIIIIISKKKGDVLKCKLSTAAEL